MFPALKAHNACIKQERNVKMAKRKADKPKKLPTGRLFQSDAADPQGSYTGRPVDPYEIPKQDEDDL